MARGTDTSRAGVSRIGGFVLSALVLVAFALVLGLRAPAAASANATWATQTAPVADVWYGISFPDTQHGWAVGLDGHIITTSDGGATWTAQFDIAGMFFECYFADVTHGWAVGPAGVYATTDGTTWAMQSGPTAFDSYWEDVEMASASAGWIVGDSGHISATTDGGAAWTPQTSGTTANLYDVNVLDKDNAWAAGAGGLVLHTTDGGTTWTQQTVAAGERFFCIDFADANTGWAGTSNGRIFATTDGGATWTEQTSGTTGTLWRSASFLGGRVWLVGSAGVLLTENGGAAWAMQDVGSTAVMWDCVFPLRGRGWVSGQNVILAYKEDYTVTVGKQGYGSVTPGTTDVIAGTDQTFMFVPDAGYRVGDVVVDGASVGAPASYEFEGVSAAHTLAVTFVPADDNHPTCVVRGWKAAWSNRPVKLHITGLTSIYGYMIDTIALTRNGWVTAPYHGSRLTVPIGDQGVTRLRFSAADVNGNWSPDYRVAVRVDTRAPKVVARAATGAAGGTARLAYKVEDAMPGCGVALVRLVVVDASGRVITRASTRQAPVNVWRTVRVSTHGLAPGSYTVVLRAMDLARNFQAGVTRTTLTLQ